MFKDLQENESQEFNNKFEEYSDKSGFKNNLRNMKHIFGNRNDNMRLLNNGNHCLKRKTLRN